MPDGWSAVGGQCLGPYASQQNPAGSSAGSAVATRLGLAAATIGTEVSSLSVIKLGKIINCYIEQWLYNLTGLSSMLRWFQAHSRADLQERCLASQLLSGLSRSHDTLCRGCSLHHASTCRLVALSYMRLKADANLRQRLNV